MLDQLKDCLDKADGYILHYTPFSDLAFALTMAVEEQHLQDFHAAVSEVLTLDALDAPMLSPTSEREWFVLLNVSFVQGEGKLRVEIPAVPG